MNYVIEERDSFDGKTRVFGIRTKKQQDWQQTEVWWDGEQAWCGSCSGPLSAMKRSCKHAAAVKRFVKIHS